MNKIILFFPILEEREEHLLPLSLILVAAPLIKKGYSIKIIDQRTEKNWQGILLKELKGKPLIVGFSVLTGQQILNALAASRLVKENSQAMVVWGGVHPSLLPQETLKNQYIDSVVIGEGEETFLELVECLYQKKSYQSVASLAYKKNGRIFVNPRRQFINLDSQPAVPYHLVNLEKYISWESFATGRPGRDIAFYTSRGCPHRCAFCYNQEFNQRRWRAQSAERVVEEIKRLIKEYQITSLNIQDDEFFVSLDRVKKICQLLEKEKIKIDFFSSCRIDYITRMDDDFLGLIANNGFKTLAVGVESGSPKILEMIHKDITREQVLIAAAKLKKFNIGGKYYFMAGFPQESKADLFQTTDLMRDIKEIDPLARIPAWRIFTPYPGIDLYDISVKEGWRPPTDLEEWAHYDFESAKMPWLDYTKETIIKNVVYLIKFLGLKNKKLSWLHRFFGVWVDLRWRCHRFNFVPEKYLIEPLIKIKKKLI